MARVVLSSPSPNLPPPSARAPVRASHLVAVSFCLTAFGTNCALAHPHFSDSDWFRKVDRHCCEHSDWSLTA